MGDYPREEAREAAEWLREAIERLDAAERSINASLHTLTATPIVQITEDVRENIEDAVNILRKKVL